MRAIYMLLAMAFVLFSGCYSGQENYQEESINLDEISNDIKQFDKNFLELYVYINSNSEDIISIYEKLTFISNELTPLLNDFNDILIDLEQRIKVLEEN